ncbi:outer membrane beta-barrel protein [bacterium]|nr:outer membrane beta-barrel protein [bacterium]
MKTKGLSILLLLAFCLNATEVTAKEKKEKKPVPEFPFKRFYIEGSLGYGFSIASGVLGSGIDYKYPGIDRCGGDWGWLKPINFGSYLSDDGCSFSEGWKVGVNFGYRFNKYLAIDFGGNYIAYINTDKWKNLRMAWRDSADERLGYSVTQDLHLRAESGNISIQLVASPGFNRVDPYAKAGMVFSFAHIWAHQTYIVYDDPIGDSFIFKQQAYGSHWAFKAGFLGAVGMNIHLSKLISLSLEWQFSVSNFIRFDWGDLKQTSEQGDKEAAQKLLNTEPQRYTGKDYLSFNSHGLRLGVKFKF